MRHRKAGKQLGRNTSHRRALLRNLTTALFKHEQIETTDSKARQLRPVAEKVMTLAKRGDLHARRQALAYLTEKGVVHRLFDELKEHYTDRQGGYVRIVKKGIRKGDGAPVSVVQLLAVEGAGKHEKQKGKKAARKKKAVSQTEKGKRVETKAEGAEKT
jgi:large subunit ribosomal protein L17